MIQHLGTPFVFHRVEYRCHQILHNNYHNQTVAYLFYITRTKNHNMR